MPAEPAAPRSRPTAVLPRADVVTAVEEAAAARSREPGFPAEAVARIRSAAAQMAAVYAPAGDLRAGALLLERQAVVDLDVPTAARVPGVGLVKRVLKALMVWYLRFLGHQITAFGQATARFGISVANRVDGLEAEIGVLRERVDRLEARLSDGPDQA